MGRMSGVVGRRGSVRTWGRSSRSGSNLPARRTPSDPPNGWEVQDNTEAFSMKKAFRRGIIMSIASALVFTGASGAFAVDNTGPSLWREYQDDFVMGTFGGWSSAQQLYHYRTSSPANQLKLDSQIGTSSTSSLSRQTYVAAVAAIEADPTLDEAEKADAIEVANENVILQPTTGANKAEGILKAIQEYN